MKTAYVHVKPLNLTYGMKIVGEGTFRQKYSRDDNAYYPSYSAIKPLVLTVPVNVQDPDGFIPTGPITLTRIDWYKNTRQASNKITTGTDYEVTSLNDMPVLKIKRNTPVSGAYDIIAVPYFINPKTGVEESVETVETLGTRYYESTLLSLRATSNPEMIINPMTIVNESDWQVPLSAELMSGEIKVESKNAAYWWYVQDGKYIRKVSASDTWAITRPNANGTYPGTLVVDASRIASLKLVCRAAYYGEGETVPEAPVNSSLSVPYNVMVKLPVLNGWKEIKERGFYLEPKDFGTDTEIAIRCEIMAGGTIVQNPEKYYNITWESVWNNIETIVGYGEWFITTVKKLGISYSKRVGLRALVTPKIGYWNVEGSIYSGMLATPVLKYGASQIADKLGAYLVKCDDGVTPQIVGKLMNNNWNRFEDGSLAPTMVNSAAEDKGYNVMYGWIETVHTIENAMVGDEIVSLFSEQPFEYNGLKSRVIPPTLICPGLPTVYDGKFRSIYFKWNATPGSDGLLGISSFNKTDRSYPKGSLSQLSTNTFALAHNSDKTKPYPFAPLMDWHLLNITNALMNKFGTVALHSADMFGGGVSSNMTTNIDHITCVSYKLSSDPSAGYPYRETLSQTPIFYVDAVGTKKTWSDILSKQYARMSTLGIQMALSYAAENNIQPNVNFHFGGLTHCYFDIPGFKTLLEGEMNARLEMYASKNNIKAYDANGNIVEYNISVCIQSSCVYGIDLVSADLMQYAGAGMERVVTITDASTGNNPNNIIRNYLCIDQTKLSLDDTIKKSVGEDFDFENSPHYTMVGENQQVNAYYTDLFRGTRIGATKKGSLYENAAYNYNSNDSGAAVGEKIRLGVKVRGSGTLAFCSARSSVSNIPISSLASYISGGFQVRLPDSEHSASATGEQG